MNRLLTSLFVALVSCAPALAQNLTAPAVSPKPASPASAAAAADCGCEVRNLPETFAIVNGVKIGREQVEPQVRARIDELQQQVSLARKRELDLQINSKLLKAEAAKRGTTEPKLLEEEVVLKAQEPTEADARAFYEKNRGRIVGEFKEVQSNIINYLRNQRQGEEAAKFAARLRAAYPVKVLVEQVTVPASDAERARVLAVVSGEKITSGDIEDSLRPLVFQVQRQVFEVRREELDSRISNLLLTQEAQKRGVTTQALLNAELSSKVAKVTDEDARKFYEQNRERLIGDFAQLKDQIVQYMQQREVERAGDFFADQLRRSSKVQVYLTAPEPPQYKIATANRPSRGNPSAPVTIVEFTDYQCPSCAQAQPMLEKLVREYDGRVQLVVRSFPLAQHADAYKAAEAAEAAFEQGKYWEYSALLIGNQSALGATRLKDYATQVGIERKAFDAALDSGKYADRVQRDIQDGIGFGVNSTPTIFVNGRQVMDRSYEALKAAIEAALKSAATRNTGAF